MICDFYRVMYHISPQDALVLLSTISSTLTAALELFSISLPQLDFASLLKILYSEPKAHSQLIWAVVKN